MARAPSAATTPSSEGTRKAARIDRYNGVYGAIETVVREQALADVARQDASPAGAVPGPL